MPSRDGYASRYLMPGECYVGGETIIVETVLGSCLAVTMFDPIKKVYGMCHSILPICPKRNKCASMCEDGFKFVECSLRSMLGKLRKAGVTDKIEVKIFGGSDMLEHYSNNSIGKQNIDAALRVIKGENLNLVAFDVGEDVGRKMVFFTDTGEVYIKRLRKIAEGPAAPRC